MTHVHTTGPALRPLVREAQAIEALGNYQDADLALRPEDWGGVTESTGSNSIGLDDDGKFWHQLFWHHAHEKALHGIRVRFYRAVFSEWVARIPGLFWREGSERLRAAAEAKVEYESKRWKTYKPQGKSLLVSGGVGTVRLPPSESGYRLASLSASYNASTGVPLLVSDDQWYALRLGEGVVGKGRATLRMIPGTWAREFPSICGLPKACLTFSKEDDGVFDLCSGAPVQVHPFTVMEYTDGNVALLDFVFACADSTSRGFRKRIERFFGHYCTERGRNGSYLVAADVSDPLWDSVFQSPAEMRGAKAAELALIEHRVREALAGKDQIETVLRDLARRETDDLRRLSEAILISPAHWQTQGTVTEEAQKLLDKAIEADKLPELIQAIQMDY